MIETPRLQGTRLEASDLSALIPLHGDKRVLSAFGADPETVEDTQEFLTRKLAHWQEHGFGIWMFRNADGTFIGRCGIHRWRGEVELGYIVNPEFWRSGYATEMATAVAKHAFATLHLSELVAFTRESNIASRGVMEKVGFSYEREFVEDDVRQVLYRLASCSFMGHS